MITIIPFNLNRINDIKIKLKMLFKITKSIIYLYYN